MKIKEEKTTDKVLKSFNTEVLDSKTQAMLGLQHHADDYRVELMPPRYVWCVAPQVQFFMGKLRVYAKMFVIEEATMITAMSNGFALGKWLSTGDVSDLQFERIPDVLLPRDQGGMHFVTIEADYSKILAKAKK